MFAHFYPKKLFDNDFYSTDNISNLVAVYL